MDKKPTAASLVAPTAAMQRSRRIKDRLANLMVAVGGYSVLLAIALIFFYLLYEVWPLFKGVDIEREAPVAVTQPALYIHSDEYNETGMRILADGQLEFLDVKTGAVVGQQTLPLPENVSISAIHRGTVLTELIGIGLSNGQLIVARPKYSLSFGVNNARTVTPSLEFPYGDTPLTVNETGAPVNAFHVHGNDNRLVVLAKTDDSISRMIFEAESVGGMASMFASDDEAKEFELVRRDELPFSGKEINAIIMGQGGIWGYVIHDGNRASVYNMRNDPVLYEQVRLVDEGIQVTTVSALLGNTSMLIGDSRGRVAQWFMVRDPASATDVFNFRKIREISLGQQPITAIAHEPRRKGFVAGDAGGVLSYYYTTSERLITQEKMSDTPIRAIMVSARSRGILVQTEDAYSFMHMDMEHPDISAKSTWGKVWYESYSAPDYIWQSSSGTTDFESKLSLMPLTFGTIKAAFYAMLLGAPIAILAAMYSAVFMSPGLRRKVKPTIELMEALPTVILGFLAGLWLAPTIEANLPGIFSLLILTPIAILLVGYLWVRMPRERRSFADGWEPLLLILPILAVGWLSFALSPQVEIWFFGGDVRRWLEVYTGLTFDQRNALIVGLAMGFAVIPNIYAIAEDALFAVPKHLTNGSLALGATPWQTLTRVVLPTASPGIFSALMIGLGRAVGETMIVLMATGNTAIMDLNIFEGMRTLSANVAVEMGEAEVGSTHFRVLFLSAFVLFVLTFILNTAAEVVRNRLRKKYGSL